MKDVLIFNPKASKGMKRFSEEKITEALSNAGISIEMVRTERAGHAAELAETAAKEGAGRVFITGGDGSINEAVNGLVRAQKQGFTGTALGFFPTGRGNDFCEALGINKNLKKMVDIISRDHRLQCDIGAAGDGTFEHYFINGSGFGIESAINYYGTQSIFSGKFSYIYGIFKAVFNDLHVQEAVIEIDGKEIIYPFVMFAAMNGRQEGGGFRLAPNFRLNDGLLDICMVGGNLPSARLLLTIPHLSKGTLDYPGILSMQASSVHVHLDPDKKGLFSQVDGETIIEHGYDFYSRISPYRLDIIVPDSIN